MKDIAVFESVERELNRQRNNIELIASEKLCFTRNLRIGRNCIN